MPQYCTIYLIRHGETEWNTQKRMQGHRNSSLTPKGKLQVKQVAQSLKHITFSAIYSSDLGRAQETAQIIAIEHKLTVVSSRLLRERYFGRLEGRRWSELNIELKDLLSQRESLASKDRFHHKLFPEIESDAEIVQRLITFMREVSLAHLDKKVLIVSHGGIMRAFLTHLGYFSYQELPAESISNSGYIKLRSDSTDFFIDKTVGITKRTPTR